MSEQDAPQRPDPALPSLREVLATYGSAEIAMELVAELELRHQDDLLVLVIKRQVDGDMPALFSRLIGDADRVEVAATFSQRILATQRKRSLADKIGDVAYMILFLASDESASCTGTDFLVDGGNLSGTRIKGAPGA